MLLTSGNQLITPIFPYFPITIVLTSSGLKLHQFLMFQFQRSGRIKSEYLHHSIPFRTLEANEYIVFSLPKACSMYFYGDSFQPYR